MRSPRWSSSIDSHGIKPQLLQILASNEAVVAISLEVRIGDRAGMMNIGIPSIIVKMLRQKFDPQWSVRQTQATEKERLRVLWLIRPSILQADIQPHGPTLSVGELLDLDAGCVLALDYPLSKPVNMLVNGRLMYRAEVVATTRKLGFEVRDLLTKEL
jgi:flagellar motor switch protein FliM